MVTRACAASSEGRAQLVCHGERRSAGHFVSGSMKILNTPVPISLELARKTTSRHSLRARVARVERDTGHDVFREEYPGQTRD